MVEDCRARLGRMSDGRGGSACNARVMGVLRGEGSGSRTCNGRRQARPCGDGRRRVGVSERYTLGPTRRRRPQAAQVPARARHKRPRRAPAACCVGCGNRGRPGRSGRLNRQHRRSGNRRRRRRLIGAAAAIERREVQRMLHGVVRSTAAKTRAAVFAPVWTRLHGDARSAAATSRRGLGLHRDVLWENRSDSQPPTRPGCHERRCLAPRRIPNCRGIGLSDDVVSAWR